MANLHDLMAHYHKRMAHYHKHMAHYHNQVVSYNEGTAHNPTLCRSVRVQVCIGM